MLMLRHRHPGSPSSKPGDHEGSGQATLAVTEVQDLPELVGRLRSALQRRGTVVGLGLLISGLTVWLTLERVELGRLPTLLSELRVVPLVVAVAIFPLAVWVKALQWQHLCYSATSARLGDLFTATALGLTVNNLAPARLGDVLRVILGAELAGLGRAQAAFSILVEKLLDLLSLALLGLALVPFAPLPWQLRTAILMTALCSLGGLAGVVVLARRTSASQRWAENMLARPRFSRLGLTAPLGAALKALRRFQHPRRLAVPFALSLLHWLLNAAMYHLVLVALDLSLPPAAAISTLVATNLGMALPSSPGFIGVFDYLCVVSLSAFGVEPTTALGFAVVVHAFGLFLPPVLGLVLIGRDGRLRRLLGFDRGASSFGTAPAG